MSVDLNDWLFKTTRMSTDADHALFRSWTSALPRRDDDEPYHCGPHNIKNFRMFVQLVNPRTILEIGFNLGHSALFWLNLGVERVVSVDNSIRPHTLQGAKVVDFLFPGRFSFVNEDSHRARFQSGYQPDAIFIDGGHTLEDVSLDIQLGLRLGVKHFFMDDYDLHHGPGVQPAIRANRLVPLAVFGNALCGAQAYCVPDFGWAIREESKK